MSTPTERTRKLVRFTASMELLWQRMRDGGEKFATEPADVEVVGVWCPDSRTVRLLVHSEAFPESGPNEIPPTVLPVIDEPAGIIRFTDAAGLLLTGQGDGG